MLRMTPVVGWIIKTNILIYFMWYLFIFIDPTFMEQNFLVSWNSLLEGRVWTLLTTVFSHNLFFHLLINMYVFFGFGMMLELIIGPRELLKLYILSGLLGSISHCLTSAYLLHQPELMALGASGSVSGVLMFFAFKYPQKKIYLLGLIPLPAFWAILVFVGIDLWGLLSQAQGGGLGIGHGAHLGGAIGGAIFFFHQSSWAKFLKKLRANQ